MSSEVEKLLNLLAEAREYIDIIGGPAGKRIVARIDAALAEPVVDYQRQRDEARAEVERLRSLKPIGTYSLDWNHEQERMTVARAAYQRGAEAMREAAVQVMVSLCEQAASAGNVDWANRYLGISDEVLSLPIPEDK